MSDLVLGLQGIRKTYRGGVEALKGINLQVPRGCIYGLLGPNGAGKSTMVKILTTLIRKSGGEGTMLGKPIGDRSALQKVGLLPKHARFPDYLTGRQVVEFTAGLQNVSAAETKTRTDALLELVQMTEAQGRKMKGYSKGMKQRIGIAQALVNDPEIVFLDEPTDGVDPAGRLGFFVGRRFKGGGYRAEVGTPPDGRGWNKYGLWPMGLGRAILIWRSGSRCGLRGRGTRCSGVRRGGSGGSMRCGRGRNRLL